MFFGKIYSFCLYCRCILNTKFLHENCLKLFRKTADVISSNFAGSCVLKYRYCGIILVCLRIVRFIVRYFYFIEVLHGHVTQEQFLKIFDILTLLHYSLKGLLSISGFWQLHAENNFCLYMMSYAKTVLLICMFWILIQNLKLISKFHCYILKISYTKRYQKRDLKTTV